MRTFRSHYARLIVVPSKLQSILTAVTPAMRSSVAERLPSIGCQLPGESRKGAPMDVEARHNSCASRPQVTAMRGNDLSSRFAMSKE